MHWIQEVKNYRNGGINHNYNYFSFYVENWWFSRLPSAAILNFSLTHRVQDLYLGQKSYLGHILPQSSTKIRGPQSVSGSLCPTTVLSRLLCPMPTANTGNLRPQKSGFIIAIVHPNSGDVRITHCRWRHSNHPPQTAGNYFKECTLFILKWYRMYMVNKLYLWVYRYLAWKSMTVTIGPHNVLFMKCFYAMNLWF